MRSRRALLSVGCVVATAALAGCATPGYNPSRVQSELVKAGTTRAQAQCVTQGLSDTFDQSELGSHSSPSAQRPARKPTDKKPPENEYELSRDVLKRCGVTLPLGPRP